MTARWIYRGRRQSKKKQKNRLDRKRNQTPLPLRWGETLSSRQLLAPVALPNLKLPQPKRIVGCPCQTATTGTAFHRNALQQKRNLSARQSLAPPKTKKASSAEAS